MRRRFITHLYCKPSNASPIFRKSSLLAWSVEELDDDHDGLNVNAVDSAVTASTRKAFLESSSVIVKHDPCHKQSVSLRHTLYPFIPPDLFGRC